jgi:PAS domain S-box-containing protein
LFENLAALLDALPFGLLVCREGKFLYVNRMLLDLLGFADLRALGKAETAGGLLNLAPDTRSSPTLIRLENASGKWITALAECETMDWDGQVAKKVIVRIGTALTSAVETEAKLQQYADEARELHTILDTATDGVAVLDASGRILALNRSGEALFGYDQNEVIGKPYTMLIAPESRSRADDYFKGLQANGVLSLLNDGREIFGLARQGGIIPLFVTLGRISANRHIGSGEADKNIKYCALLRDLTHWKKVELELEDARNQAERASALKSDFLAKVSHEIRTPLNAILGFAEVIMDERFGPVGNERYKDYLKDIHASGALVMSIVNDLLDLSKIEAGKMDLDFVSVDANQIVAECVSIMQPQANRERVIMRLALASQLPKLFADDRSLRQIILNLLSNAIKFNEPGGQVIVATTLSETRQVIIRIRDTGLGMSDEDVKIALEPFRQLATSRPQGGTGLGLPLTKALVEANRAYFSIRSKKHEGTMAEIAFPSARILAE